MNVTCARQLLGIRSEYPSADELRGAWRRFALQNHPDLRPGDPTASGRFQAGRDAYESLTAVSGRPPVMRRVAPSEADAGVYRPAARPGTILKGVDAAAAHPYAFSHVSLREWHA